MQIDAVRNPDGIYINTQCFREEGLHFMKHKYYTPDPWGSPGWRDYWKVQLDRCTNGYSTGGVRITGHHYFYLNFAQIQISEEISEKVAKKKKKMPDFWDGDYNYYWSLEIARYGILTVNETTKEERSIIQTLSTLEQAQRLKAELLFSSCFAHPSVMIKKDILIENNIFYDKNFLHVEDFHLWSILSKKTNFSPTTIESTLPKLNCLHFLL